MIRVKIDVLSGLHAGASWTFSNGEISIGGNAVCSVFLCDESVPDFCITLKVIGNRVLLKQINKQSLRGDSDLKGREGRWVYPGQEYSLDFQGVELRIAIIDISGLALTRAANLARRKINDVAEVVQQMGMRIVLSVSICLGLLSTVGVLFLGTSGAELRAASNRPKVDYVKPEQLRYPDGKEQPNRIIDSVREDILSYVKQKSIEFDILKFDTGEVSIEGKLSRAQLMAAENLLRRLAMDYGHKVKLKARFDLTDEQKLVDTLLVRSISLGDQPVVTLHSGERLFLGSTYRNLEVKEVSVNGLLLVGKNEYRVPL